MNRFAFFLGYGLSISVYLWIGLVAVVKSLPRFGWSWDLPLGTVFVALWAFFSVLGYAIGQENMQPVRIAAIFTFFFGAAVFVASFFYRKYGKK